MGEQLSLPGFDDGRQATDRLFFAILPDEIAAQRIAQLARHLKSKYWLRGEPLRTKHLHVSLHQLGLYRLPQDVVARAKEAASAIALPPFEVVLDRVVSFSGGHTDPARQDSYALVLLARYGVVELTTLRQALPTAMLKAGIKPLANARFTPHLTLLYDKRHEIAEPIEPIRWRVREFVLVHSLVGKTQHVLLGQWPLHGRYSVRSANSLAEASVTIAG